MDTKVKRNKNVLIIIREFIPYTHSVGSSIRMLKMAEFLIGNGFDVFILSARGEEIDYFGYRESLENMKIFYIDDPVHRYVTRQHKRKKEGSASKRKYFDSLFLVFKTIVNEISIPDEGIYFSSRYIQKARAIIKANGIRNVIVSSPAHSAQIIGMKLKKQLGNGINLLVDYRDSWNTRGIFKKRNRISQSINEYLEKRVLEASDRFIYVTEPVLKKINEKFFNITEKSTLVMNGYDAHVEVDPRKYFGRNNKLTIGFFGFMSDRKGSHINPEMFFRSVEKIKNKIKLAFYGSVDISRDWQERLKNTLEIHKHIPHAEVITEMRKMDLLLLLYSESDGADEVIPGKTFEYIFAERPLIVVAPENMEAFRLVREERLGYSVNIHDEDEILNTLCDIHEKWEKANLIRYSRDDYFKFSRQVQYSRLLHLLV